ncbi:MAG: YitT family protein [Alistipes sp.]|nr:YitT family protein [Alistipes sp.]
MDTGAIRNNLVSFKWWKSWIMVFIGSAILASAFVLFINPYRIVPGGVYGAGVVLHALFPSIQVGTFGLMIDIPLLLIAFRVFGGMFGAKTVFAALITPVIMNTLTAIIGEDPALMFDGRIDLSNDIIIACIFGGALVGTGVGLVVRTRATTGGTDIVAMLLTKYSKLNFSRSILVVDSLVVVFGIIVLGDWKLPLYSLVTVFVMSRTIDFVIDGASYDKLLFIISDRHDQLRSFILDEMGRGATYIKSSGMYTGNEKEMVFLVVSRREVTSVQNKIREIDKDAFVVVVDAYETFGDGFKSFPEKS